MGLAASQARLLSLTTRINHNEMESMVATNAKLRLSDKTDVAQDKYLSVLDATKLEYGLFDNNGLQQSSALTFNAVNQYNPLKNQYIFKNTSGQVYVNAKDANNFEQSNDLYEFLDKYGLFDEGKFEFQDRLDAYNKEKAEYDKEMADYQAQLDKYNKEFADYSQKLEDYNNALDQYNREMIQYEKDYQEYLDSLNTTDLYASFSNIVGTSNNPTAFCYEQALKGSTGCYLHLLNLLLDFDGSRPQVNTYTASNNKSFNTNGTTGGMGTPPAMKEISDGLNEKGDDGNYLRVCDGDDDLNTAGEQNILKAAKDAGREPTELEILRSDYIDNGDGTYSLKSLKQKAIDMYYIIQNMSGSVNSTDMKNMLINFTDGDMQKLTLEEPTMPTPPEPFDMEKPTFDLQMPTEPKKPEYTEKIYDKELAQWYINLWYAMDASDESDLLYSVQPEDEDLYYTVPDVAKETTQEAHHYIVIDDKNADNENWLQVALTNGQITMSQATFGLNADGNIVWTSIQSNNVPEITEVQDTEKIAKAEAEYQYTVSQIQIEDNKYDIELRKLDTEHNALQQQFDAIKSVINKNTERTFKMFS